MQKVVSSFPVTVSIPGNCNHVQGMVGKFRSRGNREGSSMQPVKGMALHVVGQFSTLPDSRNQKDFPGLDSEFDKCLLDG
jgi:hypothetical protein